jgi:hypothetical protein
MPIVITVPPANGTIGPGLDLQASGFTDLDVGDWIYFFARDTETNTNICTTSQRVYGSGPQGSKWSMNVTTMTDPHYEIGMMQIGKPLNEPMYVVITHTDSDGVTKESVTIDNGYKWDPVSGLPSMFALLQQNLGSSVPSGSMAQLQADVAEVKIASFGTFDPSTVVPLSEMLVAPPLGFLHRELIEPDRTGEGTLTHTATPAYGLTWEVIEAGVGIGVSEGAPDTLVTHMLDLQLIHTLGDSSLETTARHTFDYGDAMMIFDPARPSQVKYWIGPSITVRFHWLVL